MSETVLKMAAVEGKGGRRGLFGRGTATELGVVQYVVLVIRRFPLPSAVVV